MIWAVGAVLVMLLFMAPLLGLFLQPMAPWWLGQRAPAAFDPSTFTADNPAPHVGGIVSDVDRFLLALAAGFSTSEAVTATAVSIAENGSGNPAAMSAANRNGTFDLGLWQINTIWWGQLGGREALTDPMTNARAAYYVYLRQGWCAWSTFEVSCGAGHTGSYLAFIRRAQQAAANRSGH